MITHIAGLNITIDDRYLRQRCAWCGVVLLDYDLTRIAVPVGQEGPPATWPIGALIAVKGGVSWIAEGDKLPDDACASPAHAQRLDAALAAVGLPPAGQPTYAEPHTPAKTEAKTDPWDLLDETIAGILATSPPPVDEHTCGLDGEQYRCLDGQVYGPCDDDATDGRCGGACEHKHTCDCGCHTAATP